MKYASLCQHLIADVIVDRIEAINPNYWLYGHTSQQGPFCLKWQTCSTDNISEVISHFTSVQSNSKDLEGSCQPMVYRSMDKRIK